MTLYALDSSVWVEYFLGAKGEIKELIESGRLVTSIIAIAELADKFQRERLDFGKPLAFIRSRATIMPLNVAIVLEAASIKQIQRRRRPKFGLADALHLASSRSRGSILVTSDHDFGGTEGVLLLKKKDIR